MFACSSSLFLVLPPSTTVETLASSTDSAPPPNSSPKSELDSTSVTAPSQDAETRILEATTKGITWEGIKTFGGLHDGELSSA